MELPSDASQLDAASITIEASPGVQLQAILRHGDAGIPFLFVHGLASNARMWDEVAAAIAHAGHDSVAVDLRGHGESNTVDSGFDFATLTADLTSVIHHLNWDSVIAVGQSWGGDYATADVIRHGLVGLGVEVRDTPARTEWNLRTP